MQSAGCKLCQRTAHFFWQQTRLRQRKRLQLKCKNYIIITFPFLSKNVFCIPSYTKIRNNILCCLVQILCTLLSDGFSKCAYCKIIKELLHTRETNVISRLRKTRPLILRQLWLYFDFSFAINEGDKISKMCWQINLQNLCVHVSNNLSEICFVYNQNMI